MEGEFPGRVESLKWEIHEAAYDDFLREFDNYWNRVFWMTSGNIYSEQKEAWDMGDRVSIQFQDVWGDNSPYLYSHWGGMSLVRAANEFVKTIHRGEEASSVMVRFIQSSFASRFDDLRLELEGDGDNGDNGNHIIKIAENEVREWVASILRKTRSLLNKWKRESKREMIEP
jgi:hypothetical protein